MSSLFFFFKQKTAYEMRISDWSSDVCSSDLGRHRLERVRIGDHQPLEHRVANALARLEAGLLPDRQIVPLVVPFAHHRGAVDLDRKSVVSGKSVSVPVELGGRRIFKKKTKS